MTMASTATTESAAAATVDLGRDAPFNGLRNEKTKLDGKALPNTGHKGTPTRPGMQLVNLRIALCQAIYEEMKRDPNVFVMGEEVAQYNGAYKVTKGLLDEFGAKRVIDTPITESGFAGLAVGAAMTG